MKIVKVPSSQGGLGNSTGTELAPELIIKKTKELFLSEDGCLPLFDEDQVDIIKDNIEETNKNIYNKAKETLSKNTKSLFIGGDHSISYPIIRAFSEVYHGNPGVIIFDAHPDAENDFMPPTQEDLLCGIVNNKVIKKENIVLVGTRNWDKNEVEFIKNNKIKFFPMKEIISEGIEEISESVMSVAKNFSALYISIDIDVLDPAFAPGTGYIEPGGLTTRELLFFLHRLKKLRNIRAFDIVEINPKRDINGMTVKVGAKIAVELY